MNASNTTILIISFALCCGCAQKSAPINDVGFDSPDSIHSLEGCFTNHSEGENKRVGQYLSQIIWPTAKFDPFLVKAIHVVAVDEKPLRVAAVTDGNVIHESLFVEGQDFYLKSGPISDKKRAFVSFAYPPGNPFIGVGHETNKLGIDKNGDGRFQQNGAFVGTAFLFIPIAGTGEESYRFTRNINLCK